MRIWYYVVVLSDLINWNIKGNIKGKFFIYFYIIKNYIDVI